MTRRTGLASLLLLFSSLGHAQELDLLTRLDLANPWYPDSSTPPLKTPDWVDEEGVECVVVFAIDDMRDPARYEQYLRPILQRLKRIDGRAPVSIMTNSVKPDDPQLRSWLDEGLSIEVHTADHPCPILTGGNFERAKSTYDRCVDQLARIPGNSPVAFRTPCCDSLNTVSPRFFDAIFNGETPEGHFLQIDSSVFNFFTAADQSIPRSLILDADGKDRFAKYMPHQNGVHDRFVNFIENYPYPYVIAGGCWQFPCVAPSDWSAQHLHGVNNPLTVEDWKAALDITVHKQGVFNLVFHPHGWITAAQVVEFIDHAVDKHGSKVKFLNFREAADRLNRTQTGGLPLRKARASDRERVAHTKTRRSTAGRGDLRSLPEFIQKKLLAGDDQFLPLTAADGTHNGAFVHQELLCWQNEHTASLKNLSRFVSWRDLQAAHDRRRLRRNRQLIPVGTAKVDVTPEKGLRLAGYGSRRSVAEGVRSELHVRALVLGGPLERSDEPVLEQPYSVLLTVDNCGLTAAFVDRLHEAVRGEVPVGRHRFAVVSTHTHSAPWVSGFAPNGLLNVTPEQQRDLKAYEDRLFAAAVDAVRKATNTRRPARLSAATGNADFSVNRRVLEDGRWTGFGVQADGPVDHSVPLLIARDSDNNLLAVLTKYACHATTETGATNSVSADWPGMTAEAVEKQFSDVVCLVSPGCAADSNPEPRGTHELARQHAQTLSSEIVRLLRNPDTWRPIDSRLRCAFQKVDLPLGPIPGEEFWAARASGDDHQGSHAREMQRRLKEGSLSSSVENYPVQTWCFGDDLAMVFLGGEVVIDYAIRMHEMFDSDRLWINGYSNDVPCYIPSQRVLQEGGYEADSSMTYYLHPTRLAPEAEDVICDTVQKLMPHEYYSEELQASVPASMSPAESLNEIHVADGLRLDLVAAEPMINDPVAFEWDVQGRLYVVEMGDYPLGDEYSEDEESAAGRIRVLEDTDGDGRYDRAVTFLDEIGFPNGICRWGKGLLITAAPDVIYAEDTDGDLKADIRRVVLTGFAPGNQQHRMNGLRWGLDNWLHLANGDSGGTVRVMQALAKQEAPTAFGPGVIGVGQSTGIGGRDVRIRPDAGLLDPTSGQAQFGRNRDDWGNWFGNNNSNPMWHYVIPDYWLRNGSIAVGNVRHVVPEVPGAAPVFPRSRTLARFNDFHAVNRFTSACSTMIYRDRLLGDEFAGNAFTSEPVHNLVSRLILTPSGTSFRGQRAKSDADQEFFASRDNWTRPTMIRTGPDGALWIADMYRLVIEHPQWIPAEWQRKLNLQSGSAAGRIYRITRDQCCGTDVSEGSLRAFFNQPEQKISSRDLLTRLESPNGWWRDTAQRILVGRGAAEETITILKKLLSHPQAVTRLHALCTLQEIAPDPQTIRTALHDEAAGVRRHAVRLAEPWIAKELSEDVFALINDSDASVRLQLARAFHLAHSEVRSRFLPAFLAATHDETTVSVAIAAAGRDDLVPVIRALALIHHDTTKPAGVRNRAHTLTLRLWESAGRILSETDLARVLQAEVTNVAPDDLSDTQLELIERLLPGLKSSQAVWNSLATGEQASWWQGLSQRLVSELTAEPVSRRLRAIRLLPNVPGVSAAASQKVVDLVRATETVEVQRAAVDATAQMNSRTGGLALLKGWSAHTPGIRQHIVETMLRSETWTAHLLKALREGSIGAADISAVHRERLLTHRDGTTQRQAADIFRTAESTRGEIIQDWTATTSELTGNSTAGRAVFEKRCSACHRLNQVGRQVGADLAALKNRSTEALLTAILDPNRAVESKFISYTAATKTGLTYSGMLLSETGGSITLLGTDGKEQTVARTDLEELVSSGRSLMPEGLERDLSPQELIDVIAFVQSAGAGPKQFPGNQPAVIHANDQGELVLQASQAEIYGPQLVYEQKYGNLGFWGSAEDHAVWTVNVPRGGHWTVELDYACANNTAGNRIHFSTGAREFSSRVAGTGTWDDYRKLRIGQLDLGGGRRQIVVSPAGPLRSFLIDLRSIRLIPPE